MNLRQLANFFDLRVAAGDKELDREVTGGYCGDLLSDVMANAPLGCVWMTVQSHPNIVAVSVLREMAAVILTGGRDAGSGYREQSRSGANSHPAVAGLGIRTGRTALHRGRQRLSPGVTAGRSRIAPGI